MTARSAVIVPPEQGRWIDWLGSPVRILAVGDDTDGTMAIETGIVDIGDGPPPHVQSREDEGFYVLKGKLEFEAGTASVRAEAGDFVNIRPGTAHTFQNVGLDVAELFVVNAPSGFERLQLSAGEEVDGPFEPYESKNERAASIADLALDFGIDIELGEHAFEAPPEITVKHAGEGDQVNAFGDRYRFLAESADTGGRYALWHATVGPGGGPPLHKHTREEEAFYVLRGEVNVEVDGKKQTFGPGGFVSLPKGSTHRFENTGDEPAEMLVVVAPAGLEAMFRKTGMVVEADEPIAPPSDDEIQRLHAVASEYGVEIL